MLAPWKESYDKHSVLRSKDITLLTKVCIVKAMVFPVVMYRCEGWTIKKAEKWKWKLFSRVQLFATQWTYSPPSLAAKNIINLISVLTIWWCPCVDSSCAVGRGCLLWPVCSLGKTLLAFALLHSVLQSQICLLLQVFPHFLFLHSSPL